MEIISFFSFKGGVGRTALVSNLGALWASQGKTVVLIDMDLSAPGLSFSPLAREWLEEAGIGLGVSDILTTHYQQQAKDNQEEAVLMRPSMLLRRMKDPTAALDEPEWGGDGRLLLIDAGSPHMIKPNECEEGQFGPIPTLDSPDLTESKTALRALAKGIRNDLAEWKRPDNGKAIDYVLIDCRTGFAELVDLSLGFLSDRMVLISGINGQNLKGLELTLRALRTERVQLDEFPAKVAVVLSPVPTTEDEALLEAMERAHGAISAAMRQTQSGLPESSPLLYHLHYTPALAFDERPLTLRQPKSRYAREVSLIASWVDRRLTPPWEMDAVTDDTLTSLYEKLGVGATRVFVGISSDNPPPSASPLDADAEKLPNPASDLPPWYWALPPDQQSPEKRLRRLEKVVQVRPGVKIDAEAFANRLSWATMSAKEKQEKLDRLPKQRQEAVDNIIAELDSFRGGVIQVMSGAETETVLETFYQAERAWGVVANKKEATGLRRFLASPVDGECLFPSWEKWPDYWMMLARDLILELSDLPRALKAIDRAAEIGDRDTIAGDLLKLIPANRMSLSMRSNLVAKAHDLAPNSAWVQYRILATEAVLDRVAARIAIENLLNEPPRDKNNCLELMHFVFDSLPDLAYRVGSVLRSFADESKKTFRIQYLYGIYYWQINLFDKSEAAYRCAIDLEPKAAGPWHGLGNLLANSLHRYDEAEAAYRRVIELEPKAAGPWHGLGNLLANSLHRYDEAEAAYRRAIELDPKAFNPWHGLGCLLMSSLHRYGEAEAAYRRAIELDPKAFEPWYDLGSLLTNSLHRYDEAESAYRRAIELDPKAFNPWNGLGILLRHIGRCSEALECLDQGVQLQKGDSIPAINRASLLWSMGRFDAGRVDANTALEVLNCSHFSSHLCPSLALTLWLNDRAMQEMAEKLCMSAGARVGEFTTIFYLLMHKLATGVDISIHQSRIIERLQSYSNRLWAIDMLYDLSGWRPDCREAAREAAQSFYNLPAEVIRRFKDVPTPKFRLEPFIPFLEGRSDGAGDPRDLPLICREVVPSTVQS